MERSWDGDPDSATDLPVDRLCHICHHATGRPLNGDRQWSIACSRCAAIDALLATFYGARMLTPIDPRVTGGQVLHNRLWGDGVHGVTGRARRQHLEAVLAMATTAEAAGAESLTARFPGAPPWARVVLWPQWQELFPASLDASVRGYQEYVEVVHPWIDSVEPRITDADWMRGIAALSMG